MKIKKKKGPEEENPVSKWRLPKPIYITEGMMVNTTEIKEWGFYGTTFQDTKTHKESKKFSSIKSTGLNDFFHVLLL